MEMTGRLTTDAVVRTTKSNKEVVSFTVVMHDRYKTKDGEKKEVSTFVNCSYWISPKIAKFLLKGTIVTLSGHLGINSYKGSSGEFYAHIILHVNNIKIVGSSKRVEDAKRAEEVAWKKEAKKVRPSTQNN